jgi:hypothetical protein
MDEGIMSMMKIDKILKERTDPAKQCYTMNR